MKRLRDLLNPSSTTPKILDPAPVVKPTPVVEQIVEETTKKEIEEK
jgi:hypothetical protein